MKSLEDVEIMLVHPNNSVVYRNMRRSVLPNDKEHGKSNPIGLMYIAAVLQDAGVGVSILDAEARNIMDEEKYIIDNYPDVVGYTATTPLVNTCNNIAGMISYELDDVVQVIGGPHASAAPETLLDKNFDFIVQGEGEPAAPLMFEAGRNKKAKMHGIYKTPIVDNLDALPFPARDLVDNSLYTNVYTGKPTTLVVTSRGCPYHCTFCGSGAIFGKKIRYRSPANVIAEMKEIVDVYKIHNVIISDDTFTMHRQRAIDIFNGMIENTLDISFRFSTRVDRVDPELLGLAKEAGCDRITYGFESGNNDILKSLRKGITIEQSREAVRMTKEAGIKILGNYMIGVPYDTEETIMQTIDFAKELDTENAQFTIAIPLPGTEMEKTARDLGAIKSSNFDDYCFYYSPTIEHNLSKERLLELQRYAYDTYRGGKQE